MSAAAVLAHPLPPVKRVAAPTLIDVAIKKIHYGSHLAVRDVNLHIPKRSVVALIGPSGCGKSTVLRCINRMNDLIPGFRMEGSVKYGGVDLCASNVDPVAVRRQIGMVFQQPNPFAATIFSNVAFGLRRRRFKGDLNAKVEAALRSAALWDEVKDKLHTGALSLSGGQQQRLCIARAIATDPEVVLMDEPCSALDPIATAKIEELIRDLSQRHTIVIVTHNLQQARRISDHTAFLYVDDTQGGRTGYLVEYAPSEELFNTPKHDYTRDYLMGRFG
jgi:phosphate transport system ATP-binding protein